MIKKIYLKLKERKKRFFEETLVLFLSKSKFRSSLYYFLFSSAFDREHHSVLAGKAHYIKHNKQARENYFLLIRNIHRIEKGLLMKPRKDVFAKNYISETVSAYINYFSNKKLETSQDQWFTDVLDEYFKKVSHEGIVSEQFVMFSNFKNGFNKRQFEICDVNSKIPYFRSTENKPRISYDDFLALNKYRRSVRWFEEKPVERELIDKAIQVALQSPSACNRQPFEYVVIDDPEKLKIVSKFPMGTEGYAHSCKVFIVVIGNLEAYFSERDRHLIYIDASLANMAFMLALETLGLASVPINWPDIEERELMMEEYLKLEKHQRPIMCLGVGYPDPQGMVAFSEKRDLFQIRRYL